MTERERPRLGQYYDLAKAGELKDFVLLLYPEERNSLLIVEVLEDEPPIHDLIQVRVLNKDFPTDQRFLAFDPDTPAFYIVKL